MANSRFSPSGPAQTFYTLGDSEAATPSTIYVDASTLVAAVDQIGSSLAPFSTLTRALAFINAEPGIAWHIIMGFGDYSAEGALTLLGNRRYVFDGPFRSSIIMRLPPFIWRPSGTGTSYIHFRNVEAGAITVVDGTPISTVSVLVYENAACQGVNAASSAADITMIISGVSLASFETSNSTFVFAVVRANPINIAIGRIFGQNCQFDASCTLIRAPNLLVDGCSFAQNVEITGASCELRESRWITTGKTLTFTDVAPGSALLDTNTQHSFDLGNVALVNGNIITTDQTYDTSYSIPLPEGSTTGQTTFGSTVTFAGASYRIPTYVSATRIYVQCTAVSAPTTIVFAIYQNPSGQTTGTIARVGYGTLLVSAPGTFLVPLIATTRLVPGTAFILHGKINGGGNVTFRTYTTPTMDLLNDPTTVPSTAYPTAFTTTIGVTTTPPATLNPTPGGGLVTAAGASNVTALVRFATP